MSIGLKSLSYKNYSIFFNNIFSNFKWKYYEF